jgi:hypothetical protein
MGQNKLKIVFSGMIAADPHQGGATWAVLQYVLGLKELGHEVLLVEPISASAIRPKDASFAGSENARYFQNVLSEFSLEQSAALLHSETRETIGLPFDALEAFAGGADVLINISGMLTDKALISRIPVRIYLDLDPAFVQLWHETQGVDMRFDGHTHFVTVGLAIGTDSCDVPLCGREWIRTLQPLVLSHWDRVPKLDWNAITTVGNWRGYGSISHDKKLYGQKAHSFRQFMSLPRQVKEQFVIALAIHDGETPDLEALAESGWHLMCAEEAAGTPSRYRNFIQRSKAEIGIAKSGYAVSRCGWFSDRSVCYLACGRPVIAQETGFSRHLPTGRGLFSFNTTEEAAACICKMNEDYALHSEAARTLAETHFGSGFILTRLLERVGVN